MDWSWDTLTVGVLVGMCVPLAIFLILFAVGGDPVTHLAIPDWGYVLPVFRASGMPILALWLWGINLFIWHKSRINHTYIFELNPATALEYNQIIKMASFLSFIWLAMFVLYLGEEEEHFDIGIPARIYPLILTVIMLCVLLCPFNLFYRNARWFLLKVLVSVMISPLGEVRFVDFYLGDVLTSMVKTLVDLQYTTCYYFSGDFIHTETNRCKIPNKVLPPVLAFMPLFWRMMQCLRRFVAHRRPQHLLNAFKYAFGFAVILFSSIHGNLNDYAEEWDIIRLLWVISFVGSTLYMFIWDFFMDWGLGVWGSKNFPLRDQLFYEKQKWFYYYAVSTNLLFRFFWTLTISGMPFDIGISPSLLGWIAAAIEIFRRFTWSLLRVENEYLSTSDNVLRFRDTDFIPLPYDINMIREKRHKESAFSDHSNDWTDTFEKEI